MANLNCIKAVLAEKGIMSKWLAKTLQKDPATVSKWCNNHAQPDLYTLARIAEVLDVDIHRLICHTKEELEQAKADKEKNFVSSSDLKSSSAHTEQIEIDIKTDL